MNRGQILRTVFTIYILGAVAFVFWASNGFANSRPLSIGMVKGASTDPTITLAAAPEASPTPDLIAYPQPLPNGSAPVDAWQYALVDADSGRVITTSRTIQQVPIASTTKLMTSHLVSHYTDLSEMVTVSKDAASVNGSLMGLHANETMTVGDLLHGLLLVSGNDCAHALAEYIGGKLLNDQTLPADQKIARFVQAMNDEAARLNMQDTHYMDPAGLNDEGHSSAVDLGKIMTLDLKDAKLQPILDTASYTASGSDGKYTYQLKNSDRLIADTPYEGTVGGKTGFTPAAGHCLVSAATRNGHTLIAVVLHTSSNAADASAIEARHLLDYGFSNTIWE